MIKHENSFDSDNFNIYEQFQFHSQGLAKRFSTMYNQSLADSATTKASERLIISDIKSRDLYYLSKQHDQTVNTQGNLHLQYFGIILNTDFPKMQLLLTVTKQTTIMSYNSQLEPRCEKTGLRCFRPGPTQTGLYSHRR